MVPLRIGLTGGIGSGKSTVGAMLQRLGAAVIDTDLIARQLTLPGGAAMAAIRAGFGADFIAADGGLDRPRMRLAAFNDAAVRHRLEAILHPLIGVEVEREVETASASAPAIVFDVPLLIESGRWRARVDFVWLVDCEEAVQIERIVARPGWSEATARSVIGQQASRPTRRAGADAVIDNSGLGLGDLRREVELLWQATVESRASRVARKRADSL
jgi:dephospho-CoA kinase